MITIEIDYQGPRSFQEFKFKDFDQKFLDKVGEIERTYAEIDGVKMLDDSVVFVDTTNGSMAAIQARAYVKRLKKTANN